MAVEANSMDVTCFRVDGCASPWRTKGAQCPLGRPGPQAGPQGRAPALGDTVSTARPFVVAAYPSLFAFADLPGVVCLRVAMSLPVAAIFRRACYRSKKMRQSKRLTHFLFYISGDGNYTS